MCYNPAVKKRKSKGANGKNGKAQPKKHGLAVEITGVILICLSLFTLAGLLSYDSRDPSFANTPLPGHNVRNIAGSVGAYFSEGLIWFLGLIAFLLPFGLGYAAVRAVAGRHALAIAGSVAGAEASAVAGAFPVEPGPIARAIAGAVGGCRSQSGAVARPVTEGVALAVTVRDIGLDLGLVLDPSRHITPRRGKSHRGEGRHHGQQAHDHERLSKHHPFSFRDLL